MMLRLREVSNEWTDVPISAEQRRERKTRLEINAYGTEFVQFFYLQGDDGGWNSGRNCSTNSAFLHGEAREYFRSYF